MIFREFDRNDIFGICELINCELGYNVAIDDLSVRIEEMQRDKNYRIFVVEFNKNIVGFIGLHMGFAFEHSGMVMRIIALAVKKEYQNKGIGKSLIQKAQNYGAENEISIIAVNSGLNRIVAHHFYEKQGFSKKGYSFTKLLGTI